MLKIKEKTQNAVPKYNYPLAFKRADDKLDKRIFLFFDSQYAIVIRSDLARDPGIPLGTVYNNLSHRHDDSSYWEPVDVEITHKTD